jgi:GTP-binding protein
VGKSTLFNRLIGRRKAIVDAMPGVTRERNYGLVARFDVPFTLIDTGGFEPASEDRLLQQIREQSTLPWRKRTSSCSLWMPVKV